MNTNLLSSAVQEIEGLRHQNEILSAKVDVIEVMAKAMGMRNGQHGMSVDVVWELRREIARAEAPAGQDAAGDNGAPTA